MKEIELITTNAIGYPCFVFHKAIKFTDDGGQEMVLHNTTSGVELIDYDTFMKQRRILRSRHYSVNSKFHPYDIVKESNKKFNWLNNNCEDFASDVVNKYTTVHIYGGSPQRNAWITIVTTLIIALIWKICK